MLLRSAAAPVLLLLAACTRPPAPDRDAGADLPPPSAAASAAPSGPSASAAELEAPPSVAAPVPVFGLPPPAAEARRSALRRLGEEKALVPQEGILRAHFGGALPVPLDLQTAVLQYDRRAFLACDVARFRTLLADDFLGVLADGRLIDKAEFLRQAVAKPDVLDLRLRDVGIHVYGDAALVTALVTYHRADGTPVRTRYSTLYVRRGGEWAVVWSEWTHASP